MVASFPLSLRVETVHTTLPKPLREGEESDPTISQQLARSWTRMEWRTAILLPWEYPLADRYETHTKRDF
jgi:hypothetical protein